MPKRNTTLPYQTERVISPALKYIVSYMCLTIKQSCTDPFLKRSQIAFVLGRALYETAISRPLNPTCSISQYTKAI